MLIFKENEVAKEEFETIPITAIISFFLYEIKLIELTGAVWRVDEKFNF